MCGGGVSNRQRACQMTHHIIIVFTFVSSQSAIRRGSQIIVLDVEAHQRVW